MIQRDLLLARTYKLFFIVAIVFVLAFGLEAFFLWMQMQATHLRFMQVMDIVAIVFLALAVLCYIFILVLLMKARKRRLEKRRRALEGDQTLLADKQPVPNEHALPLPTTLEIRVSMNLVYAYVLLFLVIFIIGFLAASLEIGTSPRELQALLIIGAVLLFCIALVVLIGYFSTRFTRQYVIVTEDGITTRFMYKKTTIAWNEARLFCISGGTRPRRPLIYELASEKESVFWMELAPDARLYSLLFQPKNKPAAEYRQQIHLLPELVAAKTGLPLYDLRSKSFWLNI